MLSLLERAGSRMVARFVIRVEGSGSSLATAAGAALGTVVATRRDPTPSTLPEISYLQGHRGRIPRVETSARGLYDNADHASDDPGELVVRHSAARADLEAALGVTPAPQVDDNLGNEQENK